MNKLCGFVCFLGVFSQRRAPAFYALDSHFTALDFDIFLQFASDYYYYFVVNGRGAIKTLILLTSICMLQYCL